MLGKNKFVSVVLLIVVGIIWINVIVKIVGNLTADSETPESALYQDTPILLPKAEDRNFELFCDYRDPFLGKPSGVSLRGNDTDPDQYTNRVPATTPPPPATRSWPNIRYFGIVKRTHSKGGTGLVKVDNFTMNLKTGDGFYEDYIIQSMNRDSIVISRGKSERKTFYR